MSHHFAFFIFQDYKVTVSEKETERSTHLREKEKLDSRLRPFLSLRLFPKMSLLYNLASPDLGLGKTMRAFLRRVGLCWGIIVEWC